MNSPCESVVSFSNMHGSFPKTTGAYVVATLVTPGIKNRSNLCTLLAPLPPPRVCWLNKGFVRKRRGPTQRINGS